MKIVFSIIFIALTIYSYIYDFQKKIFYISVDTFNLLSDSGESVVVSFGKNDNDFHAFVIKKKDIKQGVELVSKSKNNANFSVFGDVDGEALVRSGQVETFAKVKVLSIDKKRAKGSDLDFIHQNINWLKPFDISYL